MDDAGGNVRGAGFSGGGRDGGTLSRRAGRRTFDSEDGPADDSAGAPFDFLNPEGRVTLAAVESRAALAALALAWCSNPVTKRMTSLWRGLVMRVIFSAAEKGFAPPDFVVLRVAARPSCCVDFGHVR